MSDLNLVVLIGRLGADPESKTLPSGQTVCNFRIAVGEKWKDKETGEKKESTEWAGIVAWGKTAEICTQYLRKGSQVCIRGKMKTRKWTDKSQIERWTTEVVCDEMQMLGGKPAEGAQKPPAEKPAAKPTPKDTFDDKIPF